MSRLSFALSALLFPAAAWAAPTPLERGAIVAGVSLGAEVGGAAGLGLIGFAAGGAACRDGAFECFGPFIGAGFGGGVGALVGAPLGAGMSAHAVGARPGRTVAWSLLGGGVGLGLAVTGLLVESPALGNAGLVTTAIGMPLMGGIAAATDPVIVPPPNGPVVGVAPLVGRDHAGLTLTVVGF